MSTEKMDSAAVYGLFEEIKKILKTPSKQTSAATMQLDLSKIDNLAERMESRISETTELTDRLTEVVEETRKPIIRERKITIDLVSKESVFIFIGMIAIIAVLSVALYLATRPNYDRADNDLKYRYIKMKGKATPESIAELENLFEINRDNAKIRQMRKDVEEYEQLIKEQATQLEQARLNAAQVDKLQQKAESIKQQKSH